MIVNLSKRQKQKIPKFQAWVLTPQGPKKGEEEQIKRDLVKAHVGAGEENRTGSRLTNVGSSLY